MGAGINGGGTASKAPQYGGGYMGKASSAPRHVGPINFGAGPLPMPQQGSPTGAPTPATAPDPAYPQINTGVAPITQGGQPGGSIYSSASRSPWMRNFMRPMR